MYNITVYQGADYSQAFQLLEPDGTTPISLVGYTAVAQVRARPGATGPPLATFTCSVVGATGTVTLALTDVQTATLVNAVYDVFLVGPDTALFLQGTVRVDPRVTVV